MARIVLICCWILLLSACATVTTADGERLSVRSEAFRSYAESIFRQQNQALDAVALRLDDEDDSALAAAEAMLLRQCASLNELAQRRRDRLRTGLAMRLRAARTTPGCERALETVQGLLGSDAWRD